MMQPQCLCMQSHPQHLMSLNGALLLQDLPPAWSQVTALFCILSQTCCQFTSKSAAFPPAVVDCGLVQQVLQQLAQDAEGWAPSLGVAGSGAAHSGTLQLPDQASLQRQDNPTEAMEGWANDGGCVQGG